MSSPSMPSFGEGSLTKLSSVFSIKPSETRNSVPHDVLVNRGKVQWDIAWKGEPQNTM